MTFWSQDGLGFPGPYVTFPGVWNSTSMVDLLTSLRSVVSVFVPCMSGLEGMDSLISSSRRVGVLWVPGVPRVSSGIMFSFAILSAPRFSRPPASSSRALPKASH